MKVYNSYNEKEYTDSCLIEIEDQMEIQFIEICIDEYLRHTMNQYNSLKYRTGKDIIKTKNDLETIMVLFNKMAKSLDKKNRINLKNFDINKIKKDISQSKYL